MTKNEAPPDIPLLSPPLYRLGTSITLFCNVSCASGRVSYRWSSTAHGQSDFTLNSTSVFNRKVLLTAADAGVYTCSAVDSTGNMGQASVEMRFHGMDIHHIILHTLCGG